MSDELLAEAVRALREATRPSLEDPSEAHHVIFEGTRERILASVRAATKNATSTEGR